MKKKHVHVTEGSIHLVAKVSGPAVGPGRERSGRYSMWRGQRSQWLAGQATPCPRVHRGAGQARSTCCQRKDPARTAEGRTRSASARTPVLSQRGEKPDHFIDSPSSQCSMDGIHLDVFIIELTKNVKKADLYLGLSGKDNLFRIPCL